MSRLTDSTSADEEELEPHREEIKPLNPQEEDLLNEQFHSAQDDIEKFLVWIPVSLVLGSKKELGISLGGTPATPSMADSIPDIAEVTKVEPHGLLETYLSSTDKGIIRLRSVDGHWGRHGLETLRKTLRQLGSTAEPCAVELLFSREARYKFGYKIRDCDGTALHLAALHQRGETLLHQLLQRRADPSQEYYFRSRGDPGAGQALHLAAARGFVRHMDLLLRYRADVHAYSRIKQVRNYCALHEAVLYSQKNAAYFLLVKKADVNAKNLKKKSPLHLAARSGHIRMSQFLKNYGANLKALDEKGATPVITAVEAGRYRFDKLFILMERSFEDLLVVSKLCASVAPEIMHDKGQSRIHPEWTEALVKQAETDLVSSTRHWMEIMHWSDGAGEVILDVLTVRPEAQNSNYNPIPRRARLPSGVQMVCRYECARIWEWDQESGAAPWHSLLCPGGLSIYAKRNTFHQRVALLESFLWWRRRRGNQFFGTQNVSELLHAPMTNARNFQPEVMTAVRDKESVPVKVRQLKLPGIMNPDVMSILAFTQNHNILLKPTGQAIIQYAWDHVARYYYWTYVFYQVITLGNLVVEVVSPADTFWGRRLRWSLLAVLAHLELFYEFWEMAGYLCYLQHTGPLYLTKLENLYNWVSILLLMVLVWWTSGDVSLQDIPIMLSVLVLFRWIQLTWSCRAFEYVGEKILPILQASFSTSIGGILVVTFCVLVGFLHGAMALELGHPLPQHYYVALGSLKLLLLGDGDGIDVALAVGGAPEEGTPMTFVFLLTAVVVFCVCVLNLFIAVHGEAYNRAQDKAYTSFLQERAGICLHCLLRPSWPPVCFPFRVPRRIVAYLMLELVAIGAWAYMLQEPSIHYLIPTGLLCGSAMLGDSILVQRPWDKRKGEQYYLWMCYKESLDKSMHMSDSNDLYKSLEKEVRQVSKQFERQTRSYAEQVQGLKERLQGLESSMEKLADTAEYVSGRVGRAIILE